MIERVAGLTPERFRRDYLHPMRPVVLTDGARPWPAVGKWTPEWFARTYPDLEVPYEMWAGSSDSRDDIFDYATNRVQRHARMADFVPLLLGSTGRTIYSTMFRVFDQLPELAGDIEPLDPYIGLGRALPLRNRLLLPPNLWTGPAGALTVLHFDRAHNLYVQIHGHKKWILFPPEESHNLYWPCEDLAVRLQQFSPVDAERPDLERYPRFAGARPVELVLEPGEILFVPTGWWHQVRSLDPSIALNFFWIAPVATPLALRQYYYHLARIAVTRRLRAMRRA